MELLLLATSVSVGSSPTAAPFNDHFFSDETSCRFPPDQFQLRSSPTAAPFDDHFFSVSSQPEVNSNNVDNLINVEESSSQIRSADQVTERKRKFRSTVWEHYDFGSVNGKEKAICKYCKHAYVVGSGTKGLIDHQKPCKMRFGQRSIEVYQNQSLLSGKRAIRNSVSSCLTLAAQHFDYEVSRIELSRMILMHDYPLKMVEHEGFRDYTRSLQPLFKPISRTTARRDIMSMYEIERASLLTMLGKILGRIAITLDMWTARNQKRGYMTVTSHFIDSSWQLQSRLLRFMYVPCPHNAENLSTALMNSFLDWNVDRKLSTLTLDNCSTNNSIIDILLGRLSPSSLIMNGRLFHMRCAVHILNLIVKCGLDVIEFGIERIRDSVAFWTAIPKRLEKFEEAANFLNIGYEKRLMLDCKTRWNSTYLMLSVALNYKEVFYRLNQRESQYKTKIEKSDWELAKKMCDKLKIFYSVTEMFSGTKYPTRNVFFHKICEIKISLRKWETSSCVEISSMASNMVEKFDRYWNDVHGVLAMASLLDPKFKLKLPQYFFPLIYGEDKGLVEVKKMRNLCEEIFVEHQVKVGEKRSKEIKAICNSEFNHVDEMDSLDSFFSWNSEKSSFSTSGRIVSAQRNTIDGVGDIDVDDDNDNEVNEAADCSGATKA
ncbi:hypothetical protein Ddye_004461 [Dipteronia dyeriana]|uniref:Transposase n=1 Tax=Dipteronia dyeriana TaxID=168575 RepID=A0AAD9XUV1_9ROSI|nr:hypothetical protein Ddye_004461 [Dipteronia dyeriana]